MVELPAHRDDPNSPATAQSKFWQWFERDLNESRPFSLAFSILPLIPAFISETYVHNDALTLLLYVVGGTIAFGWFCYVMFRKVKTDVRDTKRAFADFKARKRGEDIPTRCPACGHELEEFAAPNDGHFYKFEGWDCPKCGTMLDQIGNQI